MLIVTRLHSIISIALTGLSLPRAPNILPAIESRPGWRLMAACSWGRHRVKGEGSMDATLTRVDSTVCDVATLLMLETRRGT